jgi:transposase
MKLTSAEKEELEQHLNRAFSEGRLRFRRRIQIILLSNKDWTVMRLAKYFKVSKQSIWKWFKVYKEKGLEGLKGKYFSRKL